MASLFPGYAIKIFSFRQKDFKGDQRAGEFFRDLKPGIESALKDKISICFSLTDNLKSMVSPPTELISSK